MKKVLIILGIVFFLFMTLVVFAAFFLVNQEDPDYISQYDYIEASTLKNTIKEKSANAIVIINSPSCPGVSEFTPNIKEEESFLEETGIEVYFVIDILNTAGQDQNLKKYIGEYQLNYEPKIIDPEKYPAGNILNPKKKYSTFLSELCGDCNDGSLGYPFYVYYKNGNYLNHSYRLDKNVVKEIASKTTKMSIILEPIALEID